ncbi:MAG: nicotinamidase-related amidase/alkylated DNA repair dioxygenase AlkB [Myxococcota bacterium]|jgi:nicotinamidase-related amidase/alkylated DNA repair dioxygenase AlkB
MNAEHNAVLIVDMQDEFLTSAGIFKRPVDGLAMMKGFTALIALARKEDWPVVWIKSHYPQRTERPAARRPPIPAGDRYRGVPQNSDMLASGHAGRPCCVEGSPGAALYGPLAALARPDDPVVIKTYYSAFTDTDLSAILQSHGVTGVLVCGVVSNVCVRATATDAFFHGLTVTAVRDAIGATSERRRNEGLSAISKRYGEVSTVAELHSTVSAKRTGLGASDSAIHYGCLPHDLAQTALADVREEVRWSEMMHRGGPVPRKIAIQGTITDGVEPVYRHPADEQPSLRPWTATVDALRKIAEAVTGQTFNHALIQRYPDSTSYIGPHADKTLDILRGSAVVNFSLGATRPMLLRPKARDSGLAGDKVEMLHGSVFVLGWQTNRLMRHSIRQDKRADTLKRPDELRDGCERISLTFRTIATFLHPNGALSGQGARKGAARSREVEADRMLGAFGLENKDADFDWEARYGEGFDLLNFQILREP